MSPTSIHKTDNILQIQTYFTSIVTKVGSLLLIFLLAACNPSSPQQSRKEPSPSQICGLAQNYDYWRNMAIEKNLKCKNVPACAERLQQCTDTVVCTYAADFRGGTAYWSTSAKFAKWVNEAKQRGLSCNVKNKRNTLQDKNEPTITCANNLRLCSGSVVCTYATDTIGGTTFWSKNAMFYKWVKEAKKRGLSCDVPSNDLGNQDNGSCSINPSNCSVKELCNRAVAYHNGDRVWSLKTADRKFVAEAKKYGLSCNTKNIIANSKQTTSDNGAPSVSSCNSKTPSECNDVKICEYATFSVNGAKKWRPAITWTVIEAKKRGLSCSVVTETRKNKSEVSNQLAELKKERDLLKYEMDQMQIMLDQQARSRNAAYKSCLGQCMLNNKAGRGFANALNGMAQCNTSCAPLKYGGEVIPPSWERRAKRLETINCQITQLSKNQATARCNKF